MTRSVIKVANQRATITETVTCGSDQDMIEVQFKLCISS